MKNFNVAGNFQARVFIFRDGVLQCNVTPEFFESISVDGLSQDRGDITKIEQPSAKKYGEFDEVYSFSGELSRVTTTITTYMSRVSASQFFKLFEDDCAFDMHVHFGECQNPSDFTSFDKAFIFEDVRATSWSTDPLIALTSGDKGIISETLDISARRILDLINLQYDESSSAVTVDGGFVKGIVADSKNCGGDCDEPSDGCRTQFAVTDDGYLYYSVDGGNSWAKRMVIDIVATATRIPTDLIAVGNSIIILTEDDYVYVASRSEFLADPAGATFDALDVSSVITLAAADSTFNKGFIVGTAGTVATIDIYGEVELIEDGSQTSENLLSVAADESGTVLAGGANGALIASNDEGLSWTAPNSPTTEDVSAVLIKSSRNWIIGTATGELWCTDNAGATWTRTAYPGWASATTPVVDLRRNSTHVVYMLQNNRLLRSIDGGSSWTVEPSGTKKPFPTMTKNSIIACHDNINTLTVVGEDTGTGIIAVGRPIA